MTARYNPHSIEKQARQWPALFCQQFLNDDIRLRVEQLWSAHPAGWASPFSCLTPFEPDLQKEYGLDACRIALVSDETRNEGGNPQLLEPAFKWLAKLHKNLRGGDCQFSAIPWLEAAIQGRDHILQRNDARSALATLRHAVRVSPPSAGLTRNESALVFACLMPFAPLFAANEAGLAGIQALNFSEIINSFGQYICVRFSLGNGGWNQKVFDRAAFQQNPLDVLKELKQVKRSLGKHPVRLLSTGEGLRICFQ
ncbi:MAG: hypothetical protein PHD82_01700 [Candidatus Riflebacteria bacterium]|nr:hypothetical protein [Candidatus Riflebacteria bacterium]